MMEPIRPTSTITSTHTTLVPLWYSESSGTRIASTSVQIQKASAATPRATKEKMRSQGRPHHSIHGPTVPPAMTAERATDTSVSHRRGRSTSWRGARACRCRRRARGSRRSRWTPTPAYCPGARSRAQGSPRCNRVRRRLDRRRTGRRSDPAHGRGEDGRRYSSVGTPDDDPRHQRRRQRCLGRVRSPRTLPVLGRTVRPPPSGVPPTVSNSSAKRAINALHPPADGRATEDQGRTRAAGPTSGGTRRRPAGNGCRGT